MPIRRTTARTDSGSSYSSTVVGGPNKGYYNVKAQVAGAQYSDHGIGAYPDSVKTTRPAAKLYLLEAEHKVKQLPKGTL